MKTEIANELLRKVSIAANAEDGEALIIPNGVAEVEDNRIMHISGDVFEVMDDGSRGMHVGNFIRDYRNGATDTRTINGYDGDAVAEYVKQYIKTVKETEGWP